MLKPKFNLAKPPSLKHLLALTTKKGLYQHCHFNEPDKRFGYSIDDNARAIIVAYQYYELFDDKKTIELANIYLNYLQRAQMSNGYFHNFASAAGNFIDLCGSPDSQGRSIWALGYVAGKPEIDPSLSRRARKILEKFKLNLKSMGYERARAFALLGYYYAGDDEKVKRIAEKLAETYRENETENWHWFENYLTYSNAILPLAMMKAYQMTDDITYKKIGLKSLKFLNQKCLVDGIPAPIGQNGWYWKGKKKALYDQQVVDAADMVLAFSEAHRITDEQEYLDWANKWFNWFYGNNLNKIAMINPETDGCYDGLTNNGINLNQGAESTVCYLLAYLEMAKHKIKHRFG